MFCDKQVCTKKAMHTRTSSLRGLSHFLIFTYPAVGHDITNRMGYETVDTAF